MRKSIFDIMSEEIDIKNESNRIVKMLEEEDSLLVAKYGYTEKYSLIDFVNEYCFETWKGRGHCLDVDDFLEMTNYERIKWMSICYEVESFLNLIELAYNFWLLAMRKVASDKSDKIKTMGNFYHLKDVLDDLLEQYNYTLFEDDSLQRILLIEDREDVTAVAEILPNSLSRKVVKYNHRALKGDLEQKKSIILMLGNEIESSRSELKNLNAKLEDDIFFLLNNFNIRHNNSENKKTKESHRRYLASMSKDQVEDLYDDLYQLILIAILLLNNTSRTEKIQQLKISIKE